MGLSLRPGRVSSTGMTQTDAIEKAKAFIDAHSRRPSV
jgi:hypothetical protein